jgi:hypothetical protein
MEVKTRGMEVKFVLCLFTVLLTLQSSLGKMLFLPFLHRREIIS